MSVESRRRDRVAGRDVSPLRATHTKWATSCVLCDRKLGSGARILWDPRSHIVICPTCGSALT